MANSFVRTSGVVKVGRTWSVVINGKVVEGGFFGRDAAVAACLWWKANYREEVAEDPHVDEKGHEHRPCHLCGADCSTHPDAGNSLSFCGDCGKPTCPDHRVDDAAERCNACAAVHYGPESVDDVLGQGRR